MSQIKINKKYGRLTVLKLEEIRNGYKYYFCKCSCGNNGVFRSDHLLRGETKSCGCFHKDVMKRKVENLKGKKFGRLLVKRIGKRDLVENRVMWICECDCGKVLKVRAKDLKSGHTKSCGCYFLDKRRKKLGEAAFLDLYSSYKKRAKARGFSFRLSKKDFKKITKLNCFYCGKPPCQSRRRKGNRVFGEYVYNGVDRVNNNFGYYFKNCVPCCGKCNQSKSNMNIDDFYKWIKSLYKNLHKKGVI